MKFANWRFFYWVIAGLFFAFVFVKSRSVNYQENDRFNGNLRQIKELNATLNQNIFQLRYGSLTYYDPIVKDLRELKRLQNDLKNIPNYITPPGQAEIAKLREASAAIQAQKERLIEQFKSENAILKNSLYYFPTLITELAAQASVRDSELADNLNALLRDVLVYNLTASEDLAPQIERQIEILRQKREQYEGSETGADLDIAIAHARVILKHKPVVDNLLEKMVNLPTWQGSEDLYKAYNRHYEAALKALNIYRFLLYIFSIILVSGISAYIIIKLKKSARAVSAAKEKLQEALEATQKAEEKYRSIFENSTEGIYQTTPDGHFLSANPALAKIFGYTSPQELIESVTAIGRQLYVESNRRFEFEQSLQKRGSVFQFESQVYRQDGKIIWISESASTVRDARGKLLYYEGTVADITERKEVQEALAQQQEQSERLLLNILPEAIAQRLKQESGSIADCFEDVTVLFADIVGFTQLSSRLSAPELVRLLNQIFSTFDQLAEKHGLEKIKTIGDAYMVVGGLPEPRDDHAEAIAEMALDMQEAIANFRRQLGEPLNIRIGINTGPVVAGVIGLKKFIYDLWGDTVNTASRMESHGKEGCIQVTAETYQRLQEKYVFESRGLIRVKGKGEMSAYLLITKNKA